MAMLFELWYSLQLRRFAVLQKMMHIMDPNLGMEEEENVYLETNGNANTRHSLHIITGL